MQRHRVGGGRADHINMALAVEYQFDEFIQAIYADGLFKTIK